MAEIISVKQYGHASYGSAESWRRFKALRGLVNTLPQERFGQVNMLLFLFFSIWDMASPPVKSNYQIQVYSINDFKINIQTTQCCTVLLKKRAFCNASRNFDA
jgi:hypothetical protein